MSRELIERVEDEHEIIDDLLDRLAAGHPEVDLPTLDRLTRRLTVDLELTYRALYRAAAPHERWHLRPLRQRPREWAALLDDLRREPPGTPRWWIRLRDLEHRLRRHFSEVENELLEVSALARREAGDAASSGGDATSRGRTC